MSVHAATSESRHGHASIVAGEALDQVPDHRAGQADQEIGRAAKRHRRAWSWLVQIALAGAAIGSIAVLRDELPDLSDIWRAATHANAGWLAVVVAAEAASMGCFARLQGRLLRAGGADISRGRVLAVTYAGNALSTTLPAGPAVSVVYVFRQWRRGGAAASVATAVIVVGGVITTAAYSVIAMVTLLAEPHSRGPATLGLAALAAAAGALALLSWRRRSRAWLLRALRGVAQRARQGRWGRYAAPLVRMLADGLRQARGVVRLTPGDVGALTALALLNWVFDILALAAACRALGIDIAPYAVALAYFAAQAAGSLFPLLPGGLGAIEGSMIATLAAFGAGVVPAGAAVGLYRAVSFWGVVSAGWLAWLGLWLRDAAHRPAPAWARRREALAAAASRTAIGFGAMAGAATCFAPSMSASIPEQDAAQVPAPAAAAAPAAERVAEPVAEPVAGRTAPDGTHG